MWEKMGEDEGGYGLKSGVVLKLEEFRVLFKSLIYLFKFIVKTTLSARGQLVAWSATCVVN